MNSRIMFSLFREKFCPTRKQLAAFDLLHFVMTSVFFYVLFPLVSGLGLAPRALGQVSVAIEIRRHLLKLSAARK